MFQASTTEEYREQLLAKLREEKGEAGISPQDLEWVDAVMLVQQGLDESLSRILREAADRPVDQDDLTGCMRQAVRDVLAAYSEAFLQRVTVHIVVDPYAGMGRGEALAAGAAKITAPVASKHKPMPAGAFRRTDAFNPRSLLGDEAGS